MLKLLEKLQGQHEHEGMLVLAFEDRQKARLKTRLSDGREVGLFLPRGLTLRGGDLLKAEDGKVIKIEAAREPVSRVCCDDARELARISYHLGNRHVAVEVGNNCVSYLQDHVLDEMVSGMGFKVAHLLSPFEPEAGAYAAHEH